MNITKRKPFTPGEILTEEFMQPLNLSTLPYVPHKAIHIQPLSGLVRSSTLSLYTLKLFLSPTNPDGLNVNSHGLHLR